MKFWRLDCAAGGSLLLIAFLFCAPIVIASLDSVAPAAVSVKLDVATTPDNGLVGDNVNITGSGFPSETITPHNVSISLATTCGGSDGAIVLATSVIDIIGTSKRINFVIPSSLQQGTYFAAISDSTDAIPFASGNCSEVKVSAAPPTLTSITITPADSSIAKNTSMQLHATGSYSDGTTRDLTTNITTSWTSSVQSVATVVNEGSGRGLVTGVAVGSSIITATVVGVPGSTTPTTVIGSTTVTVTPAILISCTISPPNPFIANGRGQQLQAMAKFSDGTTQDVSTSASWTSSAEVAKVASGGIGGGFVMAEAVGSATITASQNPVSCSTTVTVTPAILISITITPPNPSIPKGQSVQLRASGKFSDGNTQDETTLATWTSSDPTIAEVNNGAPPGLVLGGPNLGSATITATVVGVPDSTTPTTVIGSTTVTVTPVVTITPANPSIPNGTRVQLQALESLPDGTTQNVTTSASWTSSAGVAKVAGGLVVGEALGSATIKALALDGVSGSTTVTVTPAVLTTIVLTPADSTLCFNHSEQLTATGRLSDGTQQPLLNAGLNWAIASSPPPVGKVTVGCGNSLEQLFSSSCTPSFPLGTNAGVVTADNTQGGSATITATINGSITGTATVMVDNTPCEVIIQLTK